MNISFLIIASLFAAQVPVDLEQSSLKWKGTKVTGQHWGSVKLKSGSVTLAGQKITGGEFEVDLNSIAVEDITGNAAEKLAGHLKSDDFFAVDKYPTAKFVLKSVRPLPKPKDGSTHMVSGDLTVREKTAKIAFPAKITVSKSLAEAVGQVKVDRTRWDIKYGSGKFFKGLGDKMIHDEFTLDLALKASIK